MGRYFLRKAIAIISIVVFLFTQCGLGLAAEKIGTVPDPISEHSLSGTVPIFSEGSGGCPQRRFLESSGDWSPFFRTRIKG